MYTLGGHPNIMILLSLCSASHICGFSLESQQLNTLKLNLPVIHVHNSNAVKCKKKKKKKKNIAST